MKIMKRKFGFFDVETYHGLTSEIALIGMKYIDDEYKYFTSASSFVNYLYSLPHISILYGFNSGKFDVPVILENLEREGVRYYVNHFCFSGSRLISVYLGNKVCFRDLLGVFANLRNSEGKRGLNALAKDFVGEEKKDFDCTNLEKITPELIEYNKQDVMLLEKIFYRLVRLSGEEPRTAGKLAFTIYEKKFKPDIRKIANKRGIRAVYRGGRTEIFKFYGKDVKLYDVNSLYPFVMANFAYPVGRLYPEKNINKEGYSYAVIKAPYRYIPYLPYNFNKLIFPWGRFAGYYTNFELRRAKELGYDVEVISGWVCDEKDYIFSDYVKKFYEMRLQAKKEKNKSLDTFAKILLNSLYGKFGQNPIRADYSVKLIENVKQGDNIVMMYGKTKKYVVVRRLGYCPQIYFDYIIASYITAYGRDVLFNYFQKVGEKEVIYTDTDGIITFSDMENYVSSELGALKCEGEFDYFKALLPKIYYLRKGEKEIVKAKGFKNMGSISKDMKENVFSVLGIREAMRRFSSFFKTEEKEKRLKHEYDKRIVVNDYETEPIKVEVV